MKILSSPSHCKTRVMGCGMVVELASYGNAANKVALEFVGACEALLFRTSGPLLLVWATPRTMPKKMQCRSDTYP